MACFLIEASHFFSNVLIHLLKKIIKATACRVLSALFYNLYDLLNFKLFLFQFHFSEIGMNSFKIVS